MALWAAKSMAISFGGVFDSYDAEEDDLTSVFYNELYGYQIANGPNGKWISLNLKKPKQKKKGPNKAKLRKIQQRQREEEERRRRQEEEGDDEEKEECAEDEDGDNEDNQANGHTGDHGNVDRANGDAAQSEAESSEEEDDPDDPQKTVPIARYNAMMAVQKNTLYIYGGIVESQEREFTLDDFYTLQLDKLDRFTCLKECNIAELEWKESDDEDDDDESGSDSDDSSSDEGDEGEGPEEGSTEAAEKEVKPAEDNAGEIDDAVIEADADALRAQATAFMGVAKNTERTPEDVMSTPLPGETLKTFYDRTSK